MAGNKEISPGTFYSRITANLKPEITDPKGDALAKAANRIGVPVLSIRQGKVFILEHQGLYKDAAEEQAKAIGENLLSNPVIEDIGEVQTYRKYDEFMPKHLEPEEKENETKKA